MHVALLLFVVLAKHTPMKVDTIVFGAPIKVDFVPLDHQKLDQLMQLYALLTLGQTVTA